MFGFILGCKYDKGEWSECKQGTRFRVDPLKVTDSSIGCPEVRNITKQCKERKKKCSFLS